MKCTFLKKKKVLKNRYVFNHISLLLIKVQGRTLLLSWLSFESGICMIQTKSPADS